MKYIPTHKAFTITENELQIASNNLLYAIKKIREMAKLPLTKYENHYALEDHDHAMHAIIEAAKAIGIDLGVSWGHQLDVTTVQ